MGGGTQGDEAHMIMHYTHIWSYDHLLYLYMVTWVAALKVTTVNP